MIDKLINLYLLSTKLTLSNSYDDIYDASSEALKKILNFDNFAILIKEKDMLKTVRRYGIKEPKYPLKLDGKGITVACANEGKTIYVPNVKKDKRYVESSPETKSELCSPIKFGNELIGVVNVESSKYNAFNEEDKNLLEIFASMMAAAIKNVEYKKKLMESERKYKSIFENAVEGIYRINGNGRIVEVNPSLEKLFGYSEEELKKMDLSNLYKNPKDREKFMEEVRKNGFVRNYEVEYLRKNGEIIVGNEFAILIKEGEKEFIDGIIHDVTDLKKAQQESEFYNSLLRHDIANKLQVIYGYLEILSENVKGEEKEMMKLATNSAYSAMELIDNVRKLRKIKKEKRKVEIDIDKIIEDILKEYEMKAKERNVKLIFKKSGTKLKANEFLKEAISNIVWNAIIHSKADKVKIYIEENENACICIEDNGIGIPDDIKRKIFEIGYKGKSSNGSGLGLYLSKKIVEGLNGFIEVRDAKNGGSIFKICIPH